MRKKSIFIMASFLVIVISILLLVIKVSSDKINEEEVRRNESTLNNVVGIANSLINEYFEEIEISFMSFLKEDNSSIEKLKSNIDKHENLIQRDYISIMVSNYDGDVYSKRGLVDKMSVDFDKENIYVKQKDGIEYFCFVKKFDTYFICGNECFDKFMYSIPFDIFKSFFEPMGLKKHLITMIKPNGDVVFDINGNVGNNLFTYLEKEVDDKDKFYSNIKEEINDGINGCKKIKTHKGETFITYHNLREWCFVSFSPISDSFFGEEWKNFYLLITISFGLILLSAGLFTFYTATVIIKRNKEKKSYKKLSEENKDLCNEAASAKAASAAKSDFLSRISHDIRTPMNGIVGMTHIAKMNIDNQEKVAYCLDKIESANNHLLDLLNGVLELSKIESGVVQINPTTTNIVELLKNCEDMLVSQSKKLSLNLNTSFSISHDFIIVDDLRIKQIIINILSNAVKFNRPGGDIWFTVLEEYLYENRSKLIITIKDTGIGMNEDFLSHIFEPFVQEQYSCARTVYKGSGLGMAIVKEILNLMGGEITIESKENVGTTVVITLDVEFLNNVVEPDDGLRNYDDLKGMKVLLAEDNLINIEIVEALLDEVGVNVEVAYDGEEAVKMFNDSIEGYYDVILMDVLMPKIDGYEATKLIRCSNREDFWIPIVAMTANAYDQDKEKSINCGMDGHISKPIQVERMYSTLLSIKEKTQYKDKNDW